MTERAKTKNEVELLELIERMIEQTDVILHNEEIMNGPDKVKSIIKVIEESYEVEF